MAMTMTRQDTTAMKMARRAFGLPAEGPVVLVFGGSRTRLVDLQQCVYDEEFVAGGGAYDAAANGWRQLPPGPSPRAGHAAAWTGTEMILWGGRAYGSALGDGPYGTASP